MIEFKYLVFICINLIILYINVGVNSQFYLSTNEYNCVLGIATKYLDSITLRKNSSGFYDFCFDDQSYLSVGCDGVLVRSLDITPKISLTIDPIDFQCLSYVKILRFTNPYGASVSNILSYGSYGSLSLNTISFLSMDSTVSGGSSIILPTLIKGFTDLTFTIEQTNSLIIKFSMFNKNSNIVIKSNRNSTSSFPVTYSNDLTALQTYSSIDIASTSLPSFKNVQVSTNNRAFVTLVSGYDKSSLNTNILTVGSMYDITIYGVDGDLSPFPTNIKTLTSTYTRQLCFFMNFEKPTAIIDISTTTNARNLINFKFNNVGKDFNINGAIPLKLRSDISMLEFGGGQITDFNIRTFFTTYKYLTNLKFTNNEWAGPLGTWDKNFVHQSDLHVVQLDLSNNKITGTVDESFCNVWSINLKNNLLTGTIPSCFTCFFDNAILKESFSLNSFSNFDTYPPCNTIIPNIVKDNSKSDPTRSWFYLFGKDLGGAYSSPQLMDPLTSKKYELFGLEGSLYWFVIDLYDSNGNNVGVPSSLELSFPLYSKLSKFTLATSPTPPKLVTATADDTGINFIFDGSFMTYNISIISIQVDGQNCIANGSPTFNVIYCSVSTPVTSTTVPFKVVVNVGSSASQITMVSKKKNTLLSCTSDCGYFKGYGYCDSQAGKCVCDPSRQGNDCGTPFIQCPIFNNQICNGAGTCDNTIGVCSCDSTHQGSDCSLPYRACPVYNTKICNAAGTCNNQTGVCTCDSTHQGSDCSRIPCNPSCSAFGSCDYQVGKCICDSSHQGNDCSLPYIACPVYNTKICNTAGTCNNQTGICTCDSTHQGSDCSLPYRACPIYNGQTCNAAGTCNDQTGICTCDSSHQGSDCSLPYRACPIGSNGKICSGFGTCNTYNGLCTCDKQHQSNDCSLPFIQCPMVNSKPCSGFGSCNNQTGICSCDSSHQSSNCNLPFIQCPIYNNQICNGAAGTCNNQTGVCSCDSSHQGNNCGTPFIQCPSYNGQICNGVAGTCNTQTGICSCDSSHQGNNCGTPFIQCPSYNGQICNGVAGSCDDTTGICTCDSSHQGNNCGTPFIQCPSYNGQICNGAAGTCNTQTGVCSCDSSHQGNNCGTPYILCPSYNGQICNGAAGTCNTQTGICSCDSSHQGNNCGTPLVPCPSYNGQICNGAGTCDNTIGVCSCDSSHQGNSCDTPYISCPSYNSQTCNGVAGICNNQTGFCHCDSSHQGPSCSLPLLNCPNDCTVGICSTLTGLCECPINPISWGGDNCTLPLHYLSSIEPSKEEGGDALFYGWFGDIHDGLKVLIGNKECSPISQVSNSSIKCLAPPGKGEHIVSIIQNLQNWSSSTILYKYIKSNLNCPNNCTNSNQGVCNTLSGYCTCFGNYKGSDCNGLGSGSKSDSSSSSSSSSTDEIELPSSETKVDQDTGSTTIINEKTNYELYIESLVEIDILGNPVVTHQLQKQWVKVNEENTLIHLFTQTIQNQCTINYTIEEIQGGDKEFKFAGKEFTVTNGSVKMSIDILNYQYKSNLNTLQLLMKSSVKTINTNQNKKCNDKDTEIDTINSNGESIDIITIKKDSKILYGRYIDRMISDDKVTSMTTTIISKDSESITLAMNIPHSRSIKIDPDFSVVLSTSFKSSCPSNNKPWLIPVAVSVPIVGCAVIVATSLLVYRRQFIEKALKRKIKELSLSNK